jgi:hypothetical protein
MGDITDVRHIIPISGKDSLCTAIVQMQKEPELNYEFLFNPTGSEMPEVFEWLENVEKYLGKKIHRVGKPLADIIEANNYFLPSRMARYCTRQSKILPMIEFVGGQDAEIYFGIRADENRVGFKNLWSPNISCNYPLKDAGFGIKEVYQTISAAGLKPPAFFWQRLYETVKNRLGFDPKQIMQEWVFDSAFAWRSRANCYHCFNQRQYEIAGLWEHHPALAEKALWYEKQGTSEPAYTWREKPFDWYRDNSESIVKKRANHITKLIRNKQQKYLFDDGDSAEIAPATSCGMLCGK